MLLFCSPSSPSSPAAAPCCCWSPSSSWSRLFSLDSEATESCVAALPGRGGGAGETGVVTELHDGERATSPSSLNTAPPRREGGTGTHRPRVSRGRVAIGWSWGERGDTVAGGSVGWLACSLSLLPSFSCCSASHFACSSGVIASRIARSDRERRFWRPAGPSGRRSS